MAIVKKIKARIISILNPVETVYTIELSPQNNKFKFNPGQFLHLALDEDYDGSGQWPESRCFSIQSNPSQETIIISYSIKGCFTKLMEKQLEVGSEVWVKLPYGNLFTQSHDKINTVFIAGGTGITPFLSLFNDKSFVEYVSPILYFGFRNAKFDLYNAGLINAIKLNPSLKILKINQETEGVLNITEIYKENPNAGSYFISGPQLMISNFKTQLVNLGFDSEKIKTDEWE